MSLRINQNIDAINSYRNLSVTQNQMSKSLEKLSSGFRINRAADDAAGLAISEGLRSQIGGLKVAVRNTQDGVSVVQTAEGSTNEVANIIKRMRELAVQSSSEVLATTERAYIQDEFAELTSEVERIANVTEFNGKKLTNNSNTSLAKNATKTLTLNSSVKIPSGAKNGSYYIHFWADYAKAKAEYSEAKTRLLSSGTVESIDALIGELGYAGAQRIDVQPLGAEQLGTWINAISPLLLLIGIIGLYIEFKTPGFGVFGAIGIASLVVYFFGGYVSGLAGIEWVGVFVLGVVLVAVELFWLPGTLIIGVVGVVCMLVSLLMGMTDIYPDMPWFPTGEGGGEGVPQVEGIDFALPDFSKPIRDLTIAFLLSIPVIWAMVKYMPHTALFANFASEAASGVESVAAVAAKVDSRLGQVGEATTPLHPGGKAMFGDDMCTVVTQGEMIAAGAQVKVIGHRGSDLLVIEA